MAEFSVIPILGRKTSVPPNDPSLFQFIGENVALTHDVGGLNFDLQRKRNACTKSYGYSQWSNTATAQATKCLGLFMLYDGTNRDHLFVDNGKLYYYDSSLDPQDVTKAATTYATDDRDLYSMIRVGSHVVFSDRGETAIQSWKNGDANAADAVSSGTSYKMRWLLYFMRRVVGFYSDQTNGDIDIRWTGALPTPQTSFVFAAANQLYVPNDDSIVGAKMMGTDRCFIYSDNSIHQLVYYPDYASPFRAYTVIPGQGGVNHHSIIPYGNRHFLFNKNYGFVEYHGDRNFPFGDPISDNIEVDVAGINADYYDLICGTIVPFTRKIVWTVPTGGGSSPSQLWFYDTQTRQWTFEDKVMRYVDNWRMYPNYSWGDLDTDLGGDGTGSAAWNASNTGDTWAYYGSTLNTLVYAADNGQLYYHSTEAIPGTDVLDGYRIEPILDFGNAKRKDLIKEIWFDIGNTGSYSIDISHRMGQTVGEVNAASWTSLGSISCNSADPPALRNFGKSARLHQIKWGCETDDEKFQVSKITFKFDPQAEN